MASPKRSRGTLAPLIGIALVGLAVLAVPGAAGAHAWFTYGLGGRSIGMGGASAALADEPSAAYLNPAGIVSPTQPNVTLGYDALVYDLRIDGDTADLPSVSSLTFGTTFPIPLQRVIGIRAAFGISIQMSGDVLLDQTVPFPTVPQFILHQNTARLLHLLPALAFEPWPGVEIGAGFLLFDNTVGALELGLGARGDATFDVDQELKTILSPLVGIQLDGQALAGALAGWRAGVVFRDSFDVPYRIPVNAFLGGLPLVVDFSASALYTPQQLEVGVAWSPSAGVTFAGEVLWNRWSQFPDPSLRIDLDLTIPVLPIVFTDSLVRDPGFRDTFSGRLGAEVWLARGETLDVALRAGYAFEPTPAPEQTGETNLLDNDRHIVSAGIGLRLHELFGQLLPRPLRVDGYFQAQVLASRTHVKSPEVPADNAGYPEVRGDGALYHAGLALSIELEMLSR